MKTNDIAWGVLEGKNGWPALVEGVCLEVRTNAVGRWDGDYSSNAHSYAVIWTNKGEEWAFDDHHCSETLAGAYRIMVSDLDSLIRFHLARGSPDSVLEAACRTKAGYLWALGA